MYQESVKETAREMAKQGITIMQIAEKLGVNRGTVAWWARGYCKRPGYPKEVREKAESLAEQGLSRSQISRQLNVPISTVSKWAVGINSRKQYHPLEVRKEAERMIKSGLHIKLKYNWHHRIV